MTGLELALAILPLMIAAAEHQKHIITAGKTLVSSKNKDDRQLDFYYELFDELSLLTSTLEGLFAGLPEHSKTGGPLKLNKLQLEALSDLLGTRAVSFQSILERLLKSLEDIISDKSVDLSNSDISIVGMKFDVYLDPANDLVKALPTHILYQT